MPVAKNAGFAIRRLKAANLPPRFIVVAFVVIILFVWLTWPDEDARVLSDPTISQNDPRLVAAVRRLVYPPSKREYNFDKPQVGQHGFNPSAGQTQAVEDILKGFGSDGFFVDCGANDGEWYSNTIWLETTLGWSGILIEADPEPFAKLKKKHRKAYLGNFCLSNIPHPKKMPFFVDRTLSALGSGLIKSEHYYATNAIEVQCIPLYTVLLAFNRTTVDFFSFDIEGSEIDVLLTVPFDKVIFKVITIEHSVLTVGKKGLRTFMEERGYIFYRTVVDKQFASGDSIFIHESVRLTKEQQDKIGIEDSDLERRPR